MMLTLILGGSLLMTLAVESDEHRRMIFFAECREYDKSSRLGLD